MSGRLVAAMTTICSSAVEAVHLGEELVQRLVALVVVRPDGARPRLRPIESISSTKMIDGAFCRAVLEEAAHPGRADADEHLHEVRPGDRDERHARLAGDGPGDQGLARAGRPDEQHALGDAGADLLELGRVAEELDHLADVGLDGVVAGDVVEGRRRPLRRVDVPRVASEGRRRRSRPPSSSG